MTEAGQWWPRDGAEQEGQEEGLEQGGRRLEGWESGFCCLVAKSCLTLCNPMDCDLPGSSVQGILRARIPEWVAISFSRGCFRPGYRTACPVSPALAGGSFTTKPPGKPSPGVRDRVEGD